MYNIETLFTKILRALEGILLGYLFYILKKAKISSKNLCSITLSLYQKVRLRSFIPTSPRS